MDIADTINKMLRFKKKIEHSISDMKKSHNLSSHRVWRPVASERSKICSSFSDREMEFIDLATNELFIPFPEDSRNMFSELMNMNISKHT